ncbi:MAG TPA: DotU family type IV/VI secretion system protein [Myxococcaceae bacterium]|jgi:type VI secretion system protein ImpK
MKLGYWQAILATHRKVRALLDRVLPGEVVPTARRMQPRVGLEAMNQVGQQILIELEGLKLALSSDFRTDEVDELVRPLCFLFDEMVLRRLSDVEQPLWPLLQQQLFLVDSGGDLFYEFADERLRRPDTPALVFEVLHFCLASGFTGRYVGQPSKVREYKERLTARIPKPEPVPAPAPVAPVEQPTVYEFPFRYYLTTGFVIVSLPVVLWWLSN